MKCLDVVPQSNFKSSIKRNKPEAVISISDPNVKQPYVLRLLTIPKLVLKFEDIIHPDEVNSPTKNDVQRIIDFAKEHNGKSFVVHCWAGQCRSSAAAAICEIATGRDVEATFEDLTSRFNTIWPNVLMIKHAQDILGIDLMTQYNAFSPLWFHKRGVYYGTTKHGIFH